MNLLSLVTPVFQPARLADWKVGVTATRFMGNLELEKSRLKPPTSKNQTRGEADQAPELDIDVPTTNLAAVG